MKIHNSTLMLLPVLAFSIFLCACNGGELPPKNVVNNQDAGYKWLSERLTLIKEVNTDEALSTYYRLYKSNRSGNCYLEKEEGNRSGLSVVPCSDWE